MIELKNIVKIYVAGTNKVRALKGISINFRQKELVAILGPSGCGKTTLLNIVGGLDRATSGDLVIDGKSTRDFKDSDWDTYRNQRVGFIFQSYNLVQHLNVLENVEIALTLAGVTGKERESRALKAIRSVGLYDQIRKRPNQLSGGQIQRVAIARAIVNNPDIILADEPTGSLDSKMSDQIMNILRKLSKKRLVVVVTHNKDLAREYSTRVIHILDGTLMLDSKKYTPRRRELKTLDKSLDKIGGKNRDKKDKGKVKSRMSFRAAFSLSLKNLFTKKTRTILTSFAGSIGIIGVALILAVSNGFNIYMGRVSRTSLSSYPILINTIVLDADQISQVMSNTKVDKKEDFPSDNKIFVEMVSGEMGNLSALAKYNYISPEFVRYMEDYHKGEGKKYINEIDYSNAFPLKIISKVGEEYKKMDTSVKISAVGMLPTGNFYEGLTNDEFVKGEYDVLYGKYPTKEDELALVITKNNVINKRLLDNLGIECKLNEDGTYRDIEFEELVSTDDHRGKEYKLILSDDYYIESTDEEGNVSFTEGDDYEGMYNNPNSMTLKITGILRINRTNALSFYKSGIVYTPKLTEYARQDSLSSRIVTSQRGNKDKFYFPYKLDISEIKPLSFYTPSELKRGFKEHFKIDITDDTAIEYALQQYGASSIPRYISIYPRDFKAKDKILSYIDDWNKASEDNKIYYIDATTLLSNTLGIMINAVSYILIAFASISLIVSSIMIGITSYISVVERTKEIGILRALGARKKDVGRIFNAETVIIGFGAGVIGILVTEILSIPINALMSSLVNIDRVAILKPIDAIALVIVSMLLTLVSGIIPAHIASNRDPVVALRTE